MGILTYLKLGGVVAIVLALLGNYLYVNHLRNKVTEQQAKIDSQESKIKVLGENQKAIDAIVKKLTATRRRVASEKQTIQQTVTDPSKFVDITRKYRVRQDDQTDPSKDGKGAGSFKDRFKSKTVPTSE